jgi:putative peptide zinc metalloprotease protein
MREEAPPDPPEAPPPADRREDIEHRLGALAESLTDALQAPLDAPLPPLPPATPPPLPPDDDEFRRTQVYAHPVQRGREIADGPVRAVVEWLADLLTSRAAKTEELLDRQLRAPRAVARTNLIVSLSPKGGVGKTTCTFLVGNLLASHPKLRTLVVDANPQWGTLASLAPDSVRSRLSLSDLLANLDDVDSATALRPYLSPLGSGCHLLAAPADPQIMARIGPDDYTRLLRSLAPFYEIILLDLGTGVVDPLAQAAIGAADQALLITTPEFVTTEKVIGVVGYLGATRDPGYGQTATAPPEQVMTVVLNKAPKEGSGDRQQIEAAFRRQRISKSVIVPHDDRLRVMLDSATYDLEELPRKTRLAIMRLGLAVAQDLV